MIRIKGDGATHTKCLLDPFDEEDSQLEAAARYIQWEREITMQLMVRCSLRVDEIDCADVVHYSRKIESAISNDGNYRQWGPSGPNPRTEIEAMS